MLFELPEGSGFTYRGLGGGSAIGFSEGLTEPHGWISGDGEAWYPLAGDFGLAVVPVLIPFVEGMCVKSLGEDEAEVPDVPDDYYAKVGPNPFNPQVVVRFGLPVSDRTRIEIFDVRGRRVRRLLDRVLTAGHHEVSWRGKDQSGRQVASGTYFVRIVSGDLDTVRRVTMVK